MDCHFFAEFLEPLNEDRSTANSSAVFHAWDLYRIINDNMNTADSSGTAEV